MVLIAMAWLYVVVLMALVEGFSAQGTWLGAAFTLLLYGVGPLAVALYLLGTPGRRQARRAAEAADAAKADAAAGADTAGAGNVTSTAGSAPAQATPGSPVARVDPDGGSEAPGHAIAPVREET